jgi:hypothetical protein
MAKRDVIEDKEQAEKAMPSTPTASQSLRGGNLARSSSAVGSTKAKPMPQRRIASVTGSVLRARQRVTAAAEPPSELDTIAIDTPTI